VTNLAVKVVRCLHDLAFRAPAGLGKPISFEAWNRVYASGHWDYLSNISELGRYALIANYVGRLRPRTTVLDVGCGTGLLRSFFDNFEFEAYVGMDISEEAIRQASEKGFKRTHLLVGDFEESKPDGPFGVVIFNESIGYAKNPARTFQRYSDLLVPDGLLVISMFHIGIRSKAMWRNFEALQKPIHAVRIINEKRQAWDVKIFAKDAAQ
jgi:SAM-dependent methyltransferase